MTEGQQLEFERRLSVADLDAGETQEVRIEASPAECGALARRLKIESVESLHGDLTVHRDLTGDVLLSGRLTSDVVQACVVTLEPVPERVAFDVFQRFTVRADAPEVEGEDPPEPIEDGQIEIGDVVVQNLALSLNPYPRVPDVEFQTFDDEAERPSGPFAALAQLRKKDDEPSEKA
jgi:uncharacterized metal-binding protein YceD (DUF177 family)